jgi:glucose/arabinose dehydrogenase
MLLVSLKLNLFLRVKNAMRPFFLLSLLSFLALGCTDEDVLDNRSVNSENTDVEIGERPNGGSVENPTEGTDPDEEEVPDAGGDPNLIQTAIGPWQVVQPFATSSTVKSSNVIGWPQGSTPIAPPGFTVTRFAEGLAHPRWTYVAPNNDIFVVESNSSNSANQISLLRDNDGDHIAEERHVFLSGLNQPLGMLIIGNYFYVANTDGLYRYGYSEGANSIGASGTKLVDLKAQGYNNHWTRNIISNPAGTKIYISVGSAGDVGEFGLEVEQERANIIEVNIDGTGKRIFAGGLRNPVGMDWNPVTGELWTVVNERDRMGDELVPDFFTSVVDGGWYGWPFSYMGKIKDPRWADDPHDELVDTSIVPDVPLGSHTASLGLVFYTANQFPGQYKNGAFIGQHGSWNRSSFAGYKVIFVPFQNGMPQQPQDFLTGFVANEGSNQVYGRPAGVTLSADGGLFVNDDDAGIIWKVISN